MLIGDAHAKTRVSNEAVLDVIGNHFIVGIRIYVKHPVIPIGPYHGWIACNRKIIYLLPDALKSIF